MKALEERLQKINRTYELTCNMEFWIENFVNTLDIPKDEITLTNTGEQVSMIYVCEGEGKPSVPIAQVLSNVRKSLGTNYKKIKTAGSNYASYTFIKAVDQTVVIFVVYERIKF